MARQRGSTDRRIWQVATALSALALAIVVVTLVLVNRSSPSPPTGATAAPAPSAVASATSTPSALLTVPPATPSPTPLPSPLAGPDDAGPQQVALSDPNGPQDVALRLFPSTGASCGSSANTYSADCAVTHRFGGRLQALYGAGEQSEPLCRCQAAWSSTQVRAVATTGQYAGNGDYAEVSVVFSIGSKHEALTLLVERSVDGWLANDTWCGGDMTQTMYASQPTGCAAT
jgi:hypothetical protein